ncbi:MAG: histidine kinase N-terminal 7TM domain-containing protein, partial [Myxococcota bacterium]
MTLPIETTPFLLSALLMAAIGIYSFRQSHVIGARLFAWVMASSAGWTFCYAMDLASATVAGKTFWLQTKYLAVAPSSLLWLSLTLVITGYGSALKSGWFRSLWAFPVTLILIVFTNPLHHWFWTSIGTMPGQVDSIVEHGPAFAAYTAVNHTFSAVSLALLCWDSLHTSRFYLRRNLLLIAGLLCPFIGLAMGLGLLPFSLWDRVDQVPLMYMPAALFLSFAIFRYQAMDILPLAQQLIFENIKSSIVVVDLQTEVVAMNDHARRRWSWEPAAGSLRREV